MKKPLQVIHVEDSVDDHELVRRMLQANGLECEFHRVESREQLAEALQQSKCDLILSDCTLPRFHGLEALQIAQATKPEVPFIFVSGTIGEETAIKSLQNGATDYVLKHRLSRLTPAVRRALTEAEGLMARRAMEAQLRQARKLEATATLAGGLAHDFRNVLQVLKMNISLLPLKANDPRQIIQIAEQLEKAADRGCSMVQELLLFARKTDAHLVSVNMAGQIRETVQMLRNTLPANVSLSLHLEENLPPVLADAGQLDRILTNLIANARDAMPKGGNIAIAADVIRFDRIPANSWQIKDIPYLRVKISDTGTGMDEETQSCVFEPFFTTKPAGKGTGLGLSVVFGLMDAHQGFIDLHSKVGEGTTFSLFFPLSSVTNEIMDRIQFISPTRLLGKTIRKDSSEAARENRNLDILFADQYPLRILIAEDDRISKRVLCTLLQRLGYQVECVENGLECLKAVLKGPYDLILSDVDMPEMDGIECTRRLRQAGINIPITAVTANSVQNPRELCFEAGMNGYIAKPVTLDTLKRALCEAFQKK